jgi:peptidyl-tRNA hydrolase
VESGDALTLQLAARVERSDPAPVGEICAAAGLATLRLLTDERARAGGAWESAVAAWKGDRIRKLVRRGRGTAWQRVLDLPGVTARVGRAEVRAFVPGRQADAPTALRRLQIHSPPLSAPDETHRLTARPSATMVLAVTPETAMTWGKQAAQCAHGAQRLYEQRPPDPGWLDDPRIEVIHPCPVLWEELTAAEPVEIRDGGHTEIPAGTLTVRALWSRVHPDPEQPPS